MLKQLSSLRYSTCLLNKPDILNTRIHQLLSMKADRITLTHFQPARLLGKTRRWKQSDKFNLFSSPKHFEIEPFILTFTSDILRFQV